MHTLAASWTDVFAEALSVIEGRFAHPPLTHESDETCMTRYRDGDGAAFGVLYQRYREKLHRYALRLAGRPSEAEEVFQEVWGAVIRGRQGYDTKTSFAAWLFAIAHRRAADRWRTLSRHAPDWQGDGDEMSEQIAMASSPERYAHDDALGQALLDAVAALPLPQREAFLMKAEGDLTLEEIAIATGVPRETVKSRLRYAQARLRDALEAWR